MPGKVACTLLDGFANSNGLVDIGYDMHFRVYHSDNVCASSHRYSNMMQGF